MKRVIFESKNWINNGMVKEPNGPAPYYQEWMKMIISRGECVSAVSVRHWYYCFKVIDTWTGADASIPVSYGTIDRWRVMCKIKANLSSIMSVSEMFVRLCILIRRLREKLGSRLVARAIMRVCNWLIRLPWINCWLCFPTIPRDWTILYSC